MVRVEAKKKMNREAENGNILYNKVSKGTRIVMVISQEADLGIRGLGIFGWP